MEALLGDDSVIPVGSFHCGTLHDKLLLDVLLWNHLREEQSWLRVRLFLAIKIWKDTLCSSLFRGLSAGIRSL